MGIKKLPVLSRGFLEEELLGGELANYSGQILNYPERVIQFGEGNFLRAFVDWMIHQLNKKGLFKGRIVVVQPIPSGRVKSLNKQDGLYTLLLRGIEDGEIVCHRNIITSISRGLEAYTQWEEVLKCAENPEIEFVVSNTTEAGIVYLPDDKLGDNLPDSFPGKLTSYLYRRYQHFNGDPERGMVIIPCELIDRNGDNLKKIVLQLAGDWELPSGFIDWIEQHNIFLNTLVDRIVTGYPQNEIKELEEEIGYHDENLDTGEIFHLWIIEGDKKLQEKLPFDRAGLNVKWVTDMTPYRSRKVRILNGAHTSSVPVAYLSNIDLVREAVEDKLVGEFMSKVIFDEIIPTMEFPKEELNDFAGKVLERFRNPFIDHKWLDISLNSISKFKTRVLPSIKQYYEKFNEAPQLLAFSLAALIVFYYGKEIRDNKLVCYRLNEEYQVQDSIEVLEFFRDCWELYDRNELTITELVAKVLANQKFWGDLNRLDKLQQVVANNLEEILNQGMQKSLARLLSR